MGLLKKRTKETDNIPDLPELPKLPKLPEFEDEKEVKLSKTIHQLPRFPNDSLGQKFSQNTIKEAITGKKEEGTFADEFATEEEQMMQLAPMKKFKPMTQIPMREEIDSEPRERFAHKNKEIEPIFIRIDKFEEGLKSLDKAKEQIMEIEKLIKDIQEMREGEAKELESWERKLQAAKNEIEKIDEEIFSKIE